MTKAIVCGGRGFVPSGTHRRLLGSLFSELEIREVVHGGADGADSFGRDAALIRMIPVHAFPADWAMHGKAAGPIRNRAMAEYVSDNGGGYCIAFPGGRGTANMVAEAIGRGLSIIDLRKML